MGPLRGDRHSTFAQLRSYSLHSAERPPGVWPSTLKGGLGLGGPADQELD